MAALVSEVKLATTGSERTYYDNLADLYSLFVTTELLEKAYVRDSVTASDYTNACTKLISQFKTLREALATPQGPFDLTGFAADYQLKCPAAFKRLVQVGVPATVEHGALNQPPDQIDLHVVIAQAVAHFITTMDSLKLEMKAVDELHPHLADLMTCLNKIVTLPPDHEVKVKVRDWLSKLSKMRASDELLGDEARQMSFDLEQAYNSFHRFLESNKR